jgi:hypothetical protein
LFQEASVVLKTISFAVAALVLAWGVAARADDYKPDEYLGLDLSKAVLSPKRLGPETQFAPVALEARDGSGAQARIEPIDVPKKVAAEHVHIAEPAAAPARVPHAPRLVHEPGLAHAKPAQPRGAARAKLAQRHGNPLDAQARDTRIQTWPCRSGGICNWQR